MTSFEIGHISSEVGIEGEDFIEKRALLVYEGQFLCSDEELIDVTAEKIQRLVESHNAYVNKLSAIHTPEDMITFAPPIQLEHSVDSEKTIGRVLGGLELGIYKGKVAAYAPRMRFLGKENVEKVKDKRYARLSVGANFDESTLGEVSVVTFAAAPEARLLSGKNKNTYRDVELTSPKQGDTKMAGQLPHQKLMGSYAAEMKKHLAAMAAYCTAGEKHLSRLESDEGSEKHVKALEDHLKHFAKLSEHMPQFQEKFGAHQSEMKKFMHMRAHLMSAMGMSEEQADEHCGKVSEEEKARIMESMSADVPPTTQMSAPVEDDKKEEPSEKDVKMKAFKEKFSTLSGSFNQQANLVRLATKKSQIVVKLAGLRAEGKISPAEIKKIDVTKLAGTNDATVNAVFDSYAAREPVILTGVYGTKKAEDLAKLSKLKATSDLRREALDSMPNIKKMKANVSKQNSTQMSGVDPATKPVTLPIEPLTAKMDEASEHLATLYAAGKHDEARVYLSGLMSTRVDDEAATPMTEQLAQTVSAMATLQGKFDEINQLVTTEL